MGGWFLPHDVHFTKGKILWLLQKAENGLGTPANSTLPI
jgi:hypothetical protein